MESLTPMTTNEEMIEVSETLANLERNMTEPVETATPIAAPVETPVASAPVKVARKRKPVTRRRRKIAPAPATVEASVSFGSYTSEPAEEEIGVIDQVKMAARNPLAALAGFILGGFVPVATFTVSHLDKSINEYVMWALVIGGLIYSALTVFGWAKMAFVNGLKAFGFVILIEGVMTLSGVAPLAYAALAMLVLINGIATGATLSLKGSRVK